MKRTLALALAVAVAGLAAVPAASARPQRAPVAHAASYLVAWRHVGARIVRHGGRLYASWTCDVGGTIIAAGAWWIWMTPGAMALGFVGGISFDVGCHLGYEAAHPSYHSGIPYEMRDYCFIAYPHGSLRRRFEECVA
ncbi:MAG: hypothetical protein J2P57_07770 [Acidimicrobiaceae bacterium]|nr:hypothetical protein [Acidimicrobiaceae bacterium]